MMLNYLISTTKSGHSKKAAIHDPESKLKIKVFDLVKSRFIPKKGEVTYFVTAGTEKIGFQTEGYKKHKTLLILHMIAWYCMYLGLMEAQIHPNWP
ncbi:MULTISPECIES: hypothetical protein [Mucilaginibacter]|jgi:hypothetical protein|uniref:Uncharacterized protein n=1 Tax=Mucilaginibacter ginsenosidivorans TaxID=398053 RepID=A0A5B8V1V4_9SPHI|nr:MULTISPECIES: hypothetical protein [Mucilaginibacter]QEC64783.1 hypothetical protein FRZ54_20180 [Mucilaginibacter ginsenosidivorans]HTI58069.1 hypothetical protein [Mucilaginibacter sp.]